MRSLKRFMTALMFYNVFLTLNFLNILPVRIAQVFELFICLYLLTFLRTPSFRKLGTLGHFFYVLLVLWTFFIILNGGFTSFYNIGRMLTRNQGLLCFLLLILSFRFAYPQYLNYILNFLYRWNKIYLCGIILFIPYSIWIFRVGNTMIAQTNFEALHTYIGGGLIFLIIFSYKFAYNQRKWIHLSALISVICAGIFARRGIILLYIVTYMMWLFISLSNQSLSKRIYNLIKIGIFVLLLLCIFISYGEFLFPMLFNRLTDDTRSFTELELIKDFAESGDLMFGRGILGTYNSIIENGVPEDRMGIETGYLDMVMRGGVVYVIFYILFIIPFFIRGFFCTHSKVLKNMTIYSFVFVFYFNAASSNMSLSIRYFLFLYCVFICYQKQYRLSLN